MMSRIGTLAAMLALAGLTAGCQTMDMGGMVGAGSKAVQAFSLSDQEVIALSDQSCQQMDAEHKVASANSKYNQRLQRVVKPLTKPLNGQTPSFKVYQTQEVNAWAMANGCIRVYAGLMDQMNDDELRGVIGHEMGHVELGHSKKAMQTAYSLSAARDAAAATGNTLVTQLNASQLGELSEAFLNAQFSQSQESDADDYSFELLSERQLKTQGLVTAFEKLAALDGGQSTVMSSHPGSKERAQRMQQRIDAAQ
ncbi:M48 family metallopeptidase [Alcaligenes faecalis]|uniref:M48 family metallopeptidase n=1 Tax=Alcaligenes TaxID=507 RepID=UPI0010348433|nr:peptidase [Alcaligenes faecalis]